MKSVKIIIHKGKKFFLQKNRTTGKFAFRETLLSDHDLCSMPDNKIVKIGKKEIPFLKPLK